MAKIFQVKKILYLNYNCLINKDQNFNIEHMLTINRKLIYFLLAVLLYLVSIEILYGYYLYPKYEYFGYKLYSSSFIERLSTYLFILFPIKKLFKLKNNISKLYYLFIYLLIFIPTEIFINYIRGFSADLIFLYKIILLIGLELSLFISKSNIYLSNNQRKLNAKKISKLILFLAVIAIIYIFIKYRSYFSFLSFNEIYNKRNIISVNKIDGYLIMWLSSLILPIILAYGLTHNKVFLVIIPMIAYIIFYGLFSNKVSLIAMFIIIILKKIDFNNNKYITTITLIMSAIILLFTALSLYNNLFINIACSVILMRSISIVGLLTVQYMHYFSIFQYTYFSHVNLINYLIYKYPYDRPLGFIIGKYFTNSENNNANANFIATDGVAALGPLGIIIIFIIFSLIMKIIDSYTRKQDKNFVYLSSIYFIMFLLNVSLFTLLFSGGLIFYILIFKMIVFDNKIIITRNK